MPLHVDAAVMSYATWLPRVQAMILPAVAGGLDTRDVMAIWIRRSSGVTALESIKTVRGCL